MQSILLRTRATAIGRIAVVCLIAGISVWAQNGSANIVISQVYGGGGNSGATLKNDYIELFNRGNIAVNVGGWSVQYASSGGSSWQKTNLLPISIPAGGYLLVQESAGSGGTVSLPTPDATGSIAMSATAGKVALVNNQTVLSGSCPTGLVDFVGFGGANCFEGSGPTATLSNTTAALRASGGCAETDNNSADFSAGTPNPHNSASTLNACNSSLPTSPSASGSATPASVSAGDGTLLTVTVTPGTNPPSTGVGVTADLTSIGGSATQSFSDHGNSTFSYNATVGVSTLTGAKSLKVTVTDGQARSGTATIALTVTAPVPSYAIHDIQGTGVFSPVAGKLVQTEGIVTGRKSNGFFIQAPDLEADDDPNTSEGIFVFTSTTPAAAAAVGNRVKVRGTVQDFIPSSDPGSPPVTEIAVSPTVTQLSTGNPLPTAISLTSADLNPDGAFSQLAKYEGMRVYVDTLNVVAPTGGSVSEANATASSNGVFYGVIPGMNRPFREAGIEAPAVAPAGVPQFDGNPERLRVNSIGLVGATAIDVGTGAVVSNLTGALDFAFRVYTIDPEPDNPPLVSNDDAHAVPVRVGAGEGEITVAAFNLERFYDTTKDSGDVVLTADAFERRLSKASLAIRNVLQMPDIIGVEEMEHLSTLQALAARIDSDAVTAQQTQPKYQSYLVEGNDVGGIDVGLLVKDSRIEVLSVDQVGKDATFVQPDGTTALLNDRPPLVMKVNVKREGKELPMALTIIVNHLRSLSGIDDPADGPRVRAKRLAEAEFLARLINDHQLNGEMVVSVGDYNAYEVNDGFVDVINTVRGATPHPTEDVLGESDQLVKSPLIDLAPADASQHYSYVFDGNAQVLDHIIVSQGLTVNDFRYARNDADFPESLRSDATRPERISDHDAPVAYFGVTRDTTPPVVTLTGVTEGAMYLLGKVPPAVCTTSDSESGVDVPATLQITGGDINGIGSITATCSGAADNVGNIADPVAVHYKVVAYSFAGFTAPIGNSDVKGGSTVPVKFQISDWNGDAVTNISVVTGIQLATCGSTTTTGPAATGGTSLRFDSTSNQFIFNWKTTGLKAGCYALGVVTADTLRHSTAIAIR